MWPMSSEQGQQGASSDMANPTVFHDCHQEADSSKFNAAFPEHRSGSQAFAFTTESSLVMNCQSQQLGILN